MRNINHIKLKDLEEFDGVDEGDKKINNTMNKKYITLQNGNELEDDDEYFENEEIEFRGNQSIPRRFYNFLTATNIRKAIMLSLIAISVIAITIFVSETADAKAAKKQQQPPLVFTNNRLPTWIIPIHYLVYTNIDLKQFTFNGTTIITLNITKDDHYIVIHSESLKIDQVQLQPINLNERSDYPETIELDNDKSILIPDKITYDSNNSYNIIYFKNLPKLISEGNQYFNLRLTYHSNLTDSLKGLYRSHYRDKGENKWIAITQFEPTDARSAFPCFDEPQLKAKWTIWLNIDSQYQALSNMPEVYSNIGENSRSSSLQQHNNNNNNNNYNNIYNNNIENSNSQQIIQDSRKIIKFDTSPIMSSYLVCMIVHQFDNIHVTLPGDKNDIQKTPITFRVWAAPFLLNSADYALQVAKNVTQYYIKYFNISYPLPKMDLVAIPDFAAGAMENWGCITFRQTDLLYDPNSSDVDNKARVAEVVAHEIAHQWFGDLTTMIWWTDLWLNEGFATFMSFKAMSATIQEFDSSFDFLYSIKQTGLKMDGQITTHPISNNFTNPVDIEGAFDSITYDKGASIIAMLESIMQVNGTDFFRIGIHNYLTKYSYSNAATADLWDSLYKAIKPYKDINIQNVMRNWTSEPGYPYLNVTIINSQYVITQRRFIESDDAPQSLFTGSWYIPLTYQTSCSMVNNNTIFSTPNTYLYVQSNCHDLFLLNPLSKGFYRTIYSDLLFDLIVGQLKSEHSQLGDLAKLTFLDDTFHFVQANLIPPSRVLSSLDFLTNYKEDNAVLWKTTIKGINFITDRVFAEDYYQKYEYFIQYIVQAGLLNNIEIESQNYNQKELKKIAFSTAINYDIPSISETLHDMWTSSKDNVSNIDTDIRGTMYRSIVKNGGENEYNWVYSRYHETTSINERIDALRALGNSRAIFLIYRSLNMLLNNEIRFQDFGDMIAQLSFNPYAIDKTWRFMRDNFHYFKDKLLPNDLARYYQTIGNNFNSEGLLNEFQDFFADKITYLPQTTIKNTVETIKNNINWIEKNSNEIRDWLNNSS